MKALKATAILAAMILLSSCASIYIVRHSSISSILKAGDEAQMKRVHIKAWAREFPDHHVLYETRDEAIEGREEKGIIAGLGPVDPFSKTDKIYRVEVEGSVFALHSVPFRRTLFDETREYPAALYEVFVIKIGKKKTLNQAGDGNSE